MNPTEQLLNLATNANGFAFDSVSGASYQISQLGLQIIDRIRDGVTLDELSKFIIAEYDVDEHTAERDLTIFTSNLRSLGLIEG
jgi:hypothetical protein